MRYITVKNKKLYKLFFKFELKRLQYKNIFCNTRIPDYIRQEAFDNLNKINSNSSFTAIRQKCSSTDKTRSVSNHFKLSRIKLRLLISNDYINGVKKFSR
jgi:ribosomal protein S14